MRIGSREIGRKKGLEVKKEGGSVKTRGKENGRWGSNSRKKSNRANWWRKREGGCPR